MEKLLLQLVKKWGIDCIIFDLDGTLVDTLEFHIKAFQQLFAEKGLKISYDKIAENMGRTPKDTLLSLLPNLVDAPKKLEMLTQEKEQKLSKLLTTVYKLPGAEEILKLLKANHKTLCLASSTPSYNVKKILEATTLKVYFDAIVTGEDISVGKPNPEVFLVAAKKGRCSIDSCLVIGDSTHDIKAAKNAGMKVIAVASGKHSKVELEQEQPDFLVQTLKTLIT